MSTSVGTKARKKQSPLSMPLAAMTAADKDFEQSLMSLENACLRVLEIDCSSDRHNTECLYWQQRFKNVVTPISLALVEYKGPRRFHYHYRHREDDESILHPVLEPAPIDTLAIVCKEALADCRNLVGIQDEELVRTRAMLCSAIHHFLQLYGEYSLRLKK
jgi:hypothetical protein